jgi:hypothetical protein
MTARTLRSPTTARRPARQYKGNIDDSVNVLAQIGGLFAPHAKTVADLTVLVDAGRIFAGGAIASQNQQTVSGFVAAASTQRIDRIVLDQTTGAASRVAGVESGSPVAPAVPAGKIPCAQVGPFTTSTTAIPNSMITDERQSTASAPSAGEYRSTQVFTASGTYTKPAGLVRARVTVTGGGGGGGGANAVANSAGSGGGAAGTSIKTIAAGSIGATETVTVGAGSAGGNAAGGNAAAGGSSSFGALASANGGGGGFGGSGFSTASAAVGGTASSGDMNIQGGDGNYGFAAANSGGQGGASFMGGGGQGGANGAGSSGRAYGSGGGGGGSAGGAGNTGGTGKDGIVIVEEFF